MPWEVEPRSLDPARLRSALADRRIGRRIEVRGSVGSTMDSLAALADAGAEDGAVLLADEQTAGRGRHGRTWHTPPGVALAISVLFRPDVPVERLPQIPMAVGLAALDALAPRVPDPTELALKWPNDVLVGQAKIAGLISEVLWEQPKEADRRGTSAGRSAAAQARPRLIVGLGLNVRQPADALPPGATSVAALWQTVSSDQEGSDQRQGLAPSLDRTAIAIDLLQALDRHYATLREGADLVEPWARRLATIGHEVVAHPVAAGSTGHPGAAGATPLEGRATGVTATGALRLATAQGEVLIHAGDVTLRAPSRGHDRPRPPGGPRP